MSTIAITDNMLQAVRDDKYAVVCKENGSKTVVRRNLTWRGALRAVDRLDNQYGGYKYKHIRMSDLTAYLGRP